MLTDNLIMLRNVRGLTQEQVAEIVGVTRQSYAKWEQGDSVPDIEKCDKLAKFYGIKIDALMHYAYFVQTHKETDFLLTYPDECTLDIISLERQLKETKCSGTDVEICAFVDGKLVGSAGNSRIRDCAKMRHRAEFGISIEKEYWGLGIGDALTKACIECAKNAGFLQLELDVVSGNESAINLYKKHGFVEYGRNPKGFRCRDGRWQELVLMRLELDEYDRKI